MGQRQYNCDRNIWCLSEPRRVNGHHQNAHHPNNDDDHTIELFQKVQKYNTTTATRKILSIRRRRQLGLKKSTVVLLLLRLKGTGKKFGPILNVSFYFSLINALDDDDDGGDARPCGPPCVHFHFHVQAATAIQLLIAIREFIHLTNPRHLSKCACLKERSKRNLLRIEWV